MALLLTPIVIYIARALKIYDKLDVRKVHTSTIPRIGGWAIFLSATALVTVVLFLDNSIGEAFRSIQVQAVSLLAAGTFIFLAGFVDDIYGIRVRHKLLAQLAAAVVMCLAGVRIESLNVANLFTLHLSWLSFPITIFWIVAITNAVNLIDGLDGLAAGISAITCTVIAIFSFSSGQVLMVVIMLALLGSLSGFLFFNFNPARIFMGDCGSMFLGFVLASASVMCATKSGTIIALALPSFALGLPIFDTIFSILRRYLKRQGIMSPDRSHLHHILLDMGLCQRHVVISMYALTAMIAGLGMFMMLTRGFGAIIIFSCIVVLLVSVFRIVGVITLQETIADWKQKRTISHQTKQEIENFEKVQLHFHQAKTFDQWWQAICIAAEQLGFIRIKLPLINIDTIPVTLTWQRNSNEPDSPEPVKMKIPIRGIKNDPRLNIEVDVNVNNSLESAGHRAALFGRLIDECKIDNLQTGRIKVLFVARNQTVAQPEGCSAGKS